MSATFAKVIEMTDIFEERIVRLARWLDEFLKKIAMGEKVGEEEKKEAKVENKKGEKKKDEAGLNTIVMKLDIHCEGCALKIKRAVKNFEGVDAVATDLANNKLTVIGKADPWKIRERVQSKTRKEVDLISPANPPKKDSGSKDAEPKKDQKKPDEKKAKEPAVSSAVLKIRLHCEGCIQRIKKTILRIKGVQSVDVDSQKDLVTVKGTMDVSNLPVYLKDKLKRSVDIVSQKKEGGGGGGGGGGEKKENGGNSGGEKKEEKKDEKKEKGGDGGDKKEEKKEKGGEKKEEKKEKGGEKKEEKKEKEGGGEKKDGGKKDEGGEQKQATATMTVVSTEANKMEYNGPYGYRIEMVHAPQLFSDENPNACSIM